MSEVLRQLSVVRNDEQSSGVAIETPNGVVMTPSGLFSK